MILVVDASVATKLAVQELGSDIAEKFLLENPDKNTLLAPDLMLVEVGNVLWKKFRHNEISQNHIDQACNILPNLFSLISSDVLLPRSLALSQHLDHPIYDCFYLAAAELWDGKFLTDDRKFARKIVEAGFGGRVQFLQSS